MGRGDYPGKMNERVGTLILLDLRGSDFFAVSPDEY